LAGKIKTNHWALVRQGGWWLIVYRQMICLACTMLGCGLCCLLFDSEKKKLRGGDDKWNNYANIGTATTLDSTRVCRSSHSLVTQLNSLDHQIHDDNHWKVIAQSDEEEGEEKQH